MDTAIAYFCLALSVLGIFYCPYWIKTAQSGKDARTGVFCLIASIVMFFIALFVIL